MNWKQAFALGLCSVGEYKGEPVAYLYNGVRLPDISTVWDKTAYPYAMITNPSDTSTYNLVLTPSSITVTEDGVGGSWSGKRYKIVDGVWTSVTGMGSGIVIWANYDVYNRNGTLYLAATDPIPVYA